MTEDTKGKLIGLALFLGFLGVCSVLYHFRPIEKPFAVNGRIVRIQQDDPPVSVRIDKSSPLLLLGLVFEVVESPNERFWHVLQNKRGLHQVLKVGDGMPRHEPYLYMWDQSGYVLWLATSETVSGLNLNSGPSNVAIWSTPTRSSADRAEIPVTFRDAVAQQWAYARH